MLDLDRALAALIRAGFASLPAPTESPSFTDSDWARLVEYAEREHLAAVLYRALKDSARLAQLPRASAEALHLAYVRANIASWQWTATLDELLLQFARAEIPVVLLKGAALGIALYPDPALRQLGDLDVLIRESDKARAAALLTANGFTPLLDLADGFREQFGSEQCYTRRGKRAATVDLHWNVINRPAYARAVDVEWFWARTLDVPYGKQRVTILNWDAQLVHLAEHFVIHHQMRGLRWSFDLALLLSLHKNNLEWDAILDAARRFEMLPALNAVLKHIADVWGIAAPDSVRAQLAESSRGVGDQLAVIVATADRTDATILGEGMSFRTWRQRAVYFFHVFFPSPKYMRERYRIPHPALVPVFYLVRLGLGARRLVASFAAILRNARRV